MQHPDFDVNGRIRRKMEDLMADEQFDFDMNEDKRRYDESEAILEGLGPTLDASRKAREERREDDGCALWFWRHFLIEFEVFNREVDAARQAVVMAEYEQGNPVGLQYSDGRIVRVEDWQAFKDAQKIFDEAAPGLAALPSRPTRVILNPFDGAPKTVDASEPQWLGVRPETVARGE